MGRRRVCWGIVMLAVVVGSVMSAWMPPPVSRANSSGRLERMATERVALLTMPFVENRGQVADGDVLYYARTLGGIVFVTRAGEIVYALPALSGEGDGAVEGKEQSPVRVVGWRLRERLLGASVLRPRATDEVETKLAYLLGDNLEGWQSGVPCFSGVSIGEVYPGVFLSLQARARSVEKVFTVMPGADPSAIEVVLDGAEGLTVNDRGELVAATGLGPVRFSRPVAYQEDGCGRDYVDVRYALQGDAYGFLLGAYDPARPLVIDPLLASTFVGGGSNESLQALALDQEGNVLLAGSTTSTDLPAVGPTGPYSDTIAGGEDAFVAKLDSDLHTLIALTYIGGNGEDQANALAVDSSGSVYVAGYSRSQDFPTGTIFGSAPDGNTATAFVCRLDSTLGLLQSCATLGGAGTDWATALALGNGDVYVAGHTESSDFPTTEGAYSESLTGGSDAFVARLNGELSDLQVSTLIGGSATERDVNMVVDAQGQVYLSGYTGSDDYPTEAETKPYDANHNGHEDVFVSKLSADLSAPLLGTTFIGGHKSDFGQSLAVVADGVYVVGYTDSEDFPTQGNGSLTYNGYKDVFVCKLDTDLSALAGSVLLGGLDADYGMEIATDSVTGDVYVAGYSDSSEYTAMHGTRSEGTDFTVSRLPADLSRVDMTSFVGGRDDDDCLGVVVGRAGDGSTLVYLAGTTRSDDFPITDEPYESVHKGGSDVAIAKLNEELMGGEVPTTEPTESETPTGEPTETETPVVLTGRVCEAGEDGPVKPIPGARVAVILCDSARLEDFCDKDGKYSLSIPATSLQGCDRVTVECNAEGYEALREPCPVEVLQAGSFDIDLRKQDTRNVWLPLVLR